MKYQPNNYCLFAGEIHIVERVDSKGVDLLKTLKGSTTGFVNIVGHKKSYFEVAPLPITPELLDRLGLKKGDRLSGGTNEYWELDVWRIVFIRESYRISYRNETLLFSKFIHQVQNIYEAIEEKPLTFTSNPQ